MSLLKLERLINGFSDLLGRIAGVLLVILLFNVFYDVIMRYMFNDVSIGMQELEWHLYSTIFLLGVSYSIRHDGHVRVDLIYERLGVKKQGWVDLIGSIIFLLPFTLLVFYYGLNFVAESWDMSEQSGDPGGLLYRWAIKSMIPIAFMSMAISGVGMILHSINRIRGLHQDEHQAEMQF
ncbi:MAG: TRAP transporter small permease subunit [Gammaproteobacteria bacterium]|nr:TRAP transporter small permease subunit [Gammaproteobacteria bacterium]